MSASILVAQFDGGPGSVSSRQEIWKACVVVGRVATMHIGFPTQAQAQAWADQKVQELMGEVSQAAHPYE
jgi:hypothetical protein